LAHVGYGNLALARALLPISRLEDPRIVDLADQSTLPVHGLPDRHVAAIRALEPSGFLVSIQAAEGPAPGGIWELWEISAAGDATRRGEYPPFPAEVMPQADAKLDPTGVLFQFAKGPNDVDDVIVRREVGGTTAVVYSEEDKPFVQIHSSGFISGP
jgi:hypothetical protein